MPSDPSRRFTTRTDLPSGVTRARMGSRPVVARPVMARDRASIARSVSFHVAVGGGDVSLEMQVRPKERWSMLAEQQHNPADSQRGEQEVDAEVFGSVHNIRLSL